MKQVHTRTHKLAEIIPSDPLVARMLASAIYYIHPQLLSVLNREDIHESVSAVIRAGIARLPISPMTVELHSEDKNYFVLLEETTEPLIIQASTIIQTLPAIITSSREPTTVKLGAELISVFNAPSELDGQVAAFAFCIALLLLNTKGVEKTLITHEKLNRQRSASKRPRVPSYNYLHIGTIYDAQGDKPISQANDQHVRPHLRAGHCRNQPCGKNREDTKLIYIEPVIVNADKKGDSTPTPKAIML